MSNFWKELSTVSKRALAAVTLLCAVGAIGVVFAQSDLEGMINSEVSGNSAASEESVAGVDNQGKAAKAPISDKSKKASKADKRGDALDDDDAAGAVATFLGENDWTFVAQISFRFLINIVFAYILICYIFAKEHRIKEYSFCFFISNVLIFMVTSLLAFGKVRTGFAFGLFAILSILRYRTEQIQIREMTFLFAAIIMGVINSLATKEVPLFAVVMADVFLCLCIAICDGAFMGVTDQLLLVYDNTALLAKDKKQELHEDIKNRFGYDVVKVVVTKMNYLTDSAEVKLVYKRS